MHGRIDSSMDKTTVGTIGGGESRHPHAGVYCRLGAVGLSLPGAQCSV